MLDIYLKYEYQYIVILKLSDELILQLKSNNKIFFHQKFNIFVGF